MKPTNPHLDYNVWVEDHTTPDDQPVSSVLAAQFMYFMEAIDYRDYATTKNVKAVIVVRSSGQNFPARTA